MGGHRCLRNDLRVVMLGTPHRALKRCAKFRPGKCYICYTKDAWDGRDPEKLEELKTETLALWQNFCHVGRAASLGGDSG